MKKLYIITGPAGVGKSTISKEIANRIEKCVLIEGDEIYHQVIGGYVSPWKEGNHLEVFWKICSDMMKTYLDDDFDVVFNYIVNPENLEMLKHKFTSYNVKFVILITNKVEILKRDSLRPQNSQMQNRCIELLESFKRKAFDKKFYLDTSNLSIDETIAEIERNNRFSIEDYSLINKYRVITLCGSSKFKKKL